MTIRFHTRYFLFVAAMLFCFACCAQLPPVKMPWGKGINVSFGKGTSNPGPPLYTGFTDFIYTTDSCPAAGRYTVVNKTLCTVPYPLPMDAGSAFLDVVPFQDDHGYMMIVNSAADSRPRILYADTVRSLCSNGSFLFWAGIQNLLVSTCIYPNITMRIENLSGQVLQSFQTGNIGGSPDNFSYFPGSSPLPPPGIVKFTNYYGFFLPCRLV